MLSRPYRLNSSEVASLYTKGSFVQNSHFIGRYDTSSPHPQPFRAVFHIGKKVAKTAVQRNKWRRKGYAALRSLITTLPQEVPHLPRSLSIVFQYKKTEPTLSVQEIKSLLIDLLKKVPR